MRAGLAVDLMSTRAPEYYPWNFRLGVHKINLFEYRRGGTKRPYAAQVCDLKVS